RSTPRSAAATTRWAIRCSTASGNSCTRKSCSSSKSQPGSRPWCVRPRGRPTHRGGGPVPRVPARGGLSMRYFLTLVAVFATVFAVFKYFDNSGADDDGPRVAGTGIGTSAQPDGKRTENNNPAKDEQAPGRFVWNNNRDAAGGWAAPIVIADAR